jgi:hypothetical protein
MLTQLTTTVLSLFHVIGLCAMLIGVFYFLMAILSGRGLDHYVKGIALIVIGSWISHLGQAEVATPIQSQSHHGPSLTWAAPAAPPPA